MILPAAIRELCLHQCNISYSGFQGARFSVMYRWILAFAGASALLAADEQRLALALQAQSDFERVAMAAAPDLRDSVTCTQTQAALLAVATPEELPLLHYRKGFCTLAGATVTRNANDFTTAAAEFTKAIESWPALVQSAGKNRPPEQIPSGLRELPVIARLETGFDDAALDLAQAQIASAVENPICASSVMSTSFCQAILETGREWLGWIALRHDYIEDAIPYFAGSAGTGWIEWTAGRKAFLAKQYPEAASLYRRAIDLEKYSPSSLAARLGPRPDVAAELTELGGAQLLAGSPGQAIATLDAAIKTGPANSRALFLRARARELAGQVEAALSDYNMASRIAFAGAQDLASGEAHLYRGIMLYRRKDYSHAEDEFSSALNFEIPALLRPDAAAWRHLAAVANGSCAASRQLLDRSLATVSPYFPKDEARTRIAACPSTSGAGSWPAARGKRTFRGL